MSWSTGSRAGSSFRTRRRRARRRREARDRAGGFTLLEVIVAFTILSVALVGLLQAFATGLQGLGAARASAAAVMYARSKLDEIGQSIPLADGEVSGEYDGGYTWRARIARVGDDPDSAAVEPIAVAFEIEVEVTGPRGGALTLTTLRLGAPQ